MHALVAAKRSLTFGSFDKEALWVVLIISVLALGVAYVLRSGVLRESEGTDKMREISKAIQDGSRAYLNRQFRTVAAFAVVLAIVLYFALPVSGNHQHSVVFIKLGRSIAFLVGAVIGDKLHSLFALLILAVSVPIFLVVRFLHSRQGR